MSDDNLMDGEEIIDEWTLNYLPSDGGRYVGKLVVTDQSVYFLAQFSVEFTGDAVQPAEGGIRIPKSAIARVEAKTKMWIFKRAHLHLSDGSVHVFDRGAMSVGPVIEAINAGR
jgi:hypothetical protein